MTITNRIRSIILMLPVALLLTGCVQGENEQVRTGQKLMEDYFAETGRQASVTEIYADIARPAADRLEMSDYVKGNYKLDGDKYEFWANVETGSIYTSERLQDFSDSVLKIQADKLGFDISNCTCYASLTIYPEFTGEPGNSRGQTDTVILTDVLPVTVTDMDGFAEKALESEHIFVRSFIICRKNPFAADAESPDIPGWREDQITVCELKDPDTALPTDKYDILEYWIDNRDNCTDITLSDDDSDDP
ncbi:MAG: hypothetical protein IKQ56_08760 [Lachnospiraceae bacterium]|nr:hypothetical protein [Lachnospiraceae bacterium]